MIVVISVAAAAALTVVAYSRLRQHAPESAAAGLRAVRELAAVVLVCVRAVEGVIDVLTGNHRAPTAPSSTWGYTDRYDPAYTDFEDEP